MENSRNYYLPNPKALSNYTWCSILIRKKRARDIIIRIMPNGNGWISTFALKICRDRFPFLLVSSKLYTFLFLCKHVSYHFFYSSQLLSSPHFAYYTITAAHLKWYFIEQKRLNGEKNDGAKVYHVICSSAWIDCFGEMHIKITLVTNPIDLNFIFCRQHVITHFSFYQWYFFPPLLLLLVLCSFFSSFLLLFLDLQCALHLHTSIPINLFIASHCVSCIYYTR